MRQFNDRVPMWIVAGSLLTGAMVAGAAASCHYMSEKPAGSRAGATPVCAGLTCDKGDPDDCGSRCVCNEETATCVAK